MLPEVLPEVRPVGRSAGSVAVLGSTLPGYALPCGAALLDPAACMSAGNRKAAALVPRFPELMVSSLPQWFLDLLLRPLFFGFFLKKKQQDEKF